MKISEVPAFGQLLVARVHDPKFRFDHAVMVVVTDSYHQRRFPIQWADHHRFAEHDARDGSGETDENETGHDREQKHAGHDLDRADDVPVNRLRVHVSVADSRERLHAEEKTIEKPLRSCRARDAVVVETVKEGKEKVQRNVIETDEECELRPVQAEERPI